MDTHCCLRFSCPVRVIVIKLGLLAANLSCISAPGKVFCMKQRHRHPGPGKFPMDVFIVGLIEHIGLFGFSGYRSPSSTEFVTDSSNGQEISFFFAILMTSRIVLRDIFRLILISVWVYLRLLSLRISR